MHICISGSRLGIIYLFKCLYAPQEVQYDTVTQVHWSHPWRPSDFHPLQIGNCTGGIGPTTGGVAVLRQRQDLMARFIFTRMHPLASSPRLSHTALIYTIASLAAAAARLVLPFVRHLVVQAAYIMLTATSLSCSQLVRHLVFRAADNVQVTPF